MTRVHCDTGAPASAAGGRDDRPGIHAREEGRCGRGRGERVGRAIALAFAAAGAAVACADVEEPGAKATAAEIEAGGARALPVPLDVTDGAGCRAAVAATVQRFGGLDVLLYGAADSDRTATVLELDEAAWDRVIRVNLTGAFLMIPS